MKTLTLNTCKALACMLCMVFLYACNEAPTKEAPNESPVIPVKNTPNPEYTLTKDQTHNKFSSEIEPVLTVPSGAIIEAFTEDASDEQLLAKATLADLRNLSFDPIHPLTGPVYVEGAEVGDVLAVTLHEVELGDYGWNAITPGFGFLADEFEDPYIRTYTFDSTTTSVAFNDNITIPLHPFPGVMGVAPATKEMLSTIPPRANGGNMDDPNLTEGTTVYFPVFVEGALFSIGDAHAAQGLGEVCGTAIESPYAICVRGQCDQGKENTGASVRKRRLLRGHGFWRNH